MSVKRTALITGGTGALGTAIARALHDAGHHVLISDYAPVGQTELSAQAQQWLTEQQQDGYDFTAYAIDVSDNLSSQQGIERIHNDGHSIDILVNCAGITRDATLRRMDFEQWDSVIRTNLNSMFNMTKPVIDGMTERGWGRIINISSVNGSKGAFGQTNYSAAKSGIYGFTKALALEVARKGVTVNAISPGYLDSPMVRQVPQDVLESKVIPEIPIGRLGQPEEIAAGVVFLCSDLAGLVTGANLPMNGGQHMY